MKNFKENKYWRTHKQRKGCSRLVITVVMCRTKRLIVRCSISHDRLLFWWADQFNFRCSLLTTAISKRCYVTSSGLTNASCISFSNRMFRMDELQMWRYLLSIFIDEHSRIRKLATVAFAVFDEIGLSERRVWCKVIILPASEKTFSLAKENALIDMMWWANTTTWSYLHV